MRDWNFISLMIGTFLMIKNILNNVAEFKKWSVTHWASTMSLDLETDGLHWGCKIIGISASNGTAACYIRVNDDNQDGVLVTLQDHLNMTQLLLLHNGSFDLRVLDRN